ncbi:MAG: zinc ribbon domain-containing protein [Dehalococcoidia bacterium]|nr:zinc ribbon domain-containing protein [Dehalococcoidia bacterium]
METQTVCGSCGAFLGSDAKFCRACGQAVVCASCGAQIGAGAKFCKACGQALGQGVVGVRAATPSGRRFRACAERSAPAQTAPGTPSAGRRGDGRRRDTRHWSRRDDRSPWRWREGRR